MKEENVILIVLIIASILAMMIIPKAEAWEYYDTTISNPQTDDLVEGFGPRADKIQIIQYGKEIAEFLALELGQIDIIDLPVGSAHYGPWTTPGMNGPGYQDRIAVVDTGAEFGMYILDLRMDNRSYINTTNTDDNIPISNPAYNNQNGNPMANLALRRAIASIADRYYAVNTIMSGNSPPALASALYTPLSVAYGDWCHPEIKPTGALAQWCYVLANESANVAGGLAYLAAAGYTYDPVADATKDPTGYQFTIEFHYAGWSRDIYGWKVARELIEPLMEAPPPNGLGMKNNLKMVDESLTMDPDVKHDKAGHMYIGKWGLATDPDHLFYLFNSANYWHPGSPPNYMYYPGDCDKYTVPVDGWTYTGFPEIYGWGTSGLDFSDPDKTWNAGDEVWMNPNNYWSWEMMTATSQARAQLAALKSQEFLAWYVCGIPFWASNSYTAFHRTYTGPEAPYSGHDWMGVVDQEGLGVWGTASLYNMHTDNAEWGSGAPMVIRQGLRQPVYSLNPIYADSTSDWYVLNKAYDSMIGVHPYDTSVDTQNLADSWEIGTWNRPNYGTCTRVTFHMRHDLFWSDGVPMTASDVKFTWGGPLITGSLSNMLANKGYPPHYWSSQVADIISIATPDPFTVIVCFDTPAYFGLHWMSGFNIVLPEHIWKPIIETGDPTQPWDQPSVCSSGYVMDHTWDPTLHGGVITLSRNTRNYTIDPYAEQTDSKPRPVRVWADQMSNAREVYGNTHYIYPLSGDTVINLDVNVHLQNSYAYRTGPHKSEAYPFTRLKGEKNVTLEIWNGGSIGDSDNYALYRTLAINEPWTAQRGITEIEQYKINDVTAWWYIINITTHITSLEYSNDGLTWIDASGSNPFNDMAYTYREYALVTSRYDIGGASWKTIASKPYQPISDLKVDVKDVYICGKAYPSEPGEAKWNPACDVNNDYKVDIKDYYKIAQNNGWHATLPS